MNTTLPNPPSARRSRRRLGVVASLGAVAALVFAACGDDEDDSPDDTEVEPVTSEVTETTTLTVESEVTIGTTVESEVQVTETEVSEVQITDPSATTGG